MARWPWFERKFEFNFPPAKFPDLLERWRGTPARIEERVRGLTRDVLVRRLGETWSIQENIGHLLAEATLPEQRLAQIIAGETTLVAADVTNRRTHEANFNDREIGELLAAFRKRRMGLVARFEAVNESDWGKSGLHPRLNQPMRIVDLLHFDCEHDDYHLARIGELIRLFAAA